MTALRLLCFMTLLTGVLYPLSVYWTAQTLFPEKANGSLILRNHQVIGSSLIGQSFQQDGYFWSRPSATGYSSMPSGGSNISPSAQKNTPNAEKLPGNLAMASASGLDPHITVAAARSQMKRVIQARHLSPIQQDRLWEALDRCTAHPDLGLLGETRVNVIALNLALDRIH